MHTVPTGPASDREGPGLLRPGGVGGVDRLAGVPNRLHGARILLADALLQRRRLDHAAAGCALHRHRDGVHDGRGDDGHGPVYGHVYDEPGRSQPDVDGAPAPRSEEHTSELQSLMRISYAVFCLKKKIQTQIINYITT